MFTFVWKVKELVYHNPPSVLFCIHCSKYDMTIALFVQFTVP